MSFNEIHSVFGDILKTPLRLAIAIHTNPDGDAKGSAIALSNVLSQMGHTVKEIIPNMYPSFMAWMPG